MRMFLWNILLALVWAAMIGAMTPVHILTGFVLAYIALLLARPITGPSVYFSKTRQAAGFLLWFAWQMLVSNARVAYDVVTPGHNARPGVVAIPMEAETPLEITLLANLVTLTPGTLSLDVSDDQKTLYIHAMFMDGGADDLRREIKDGLEKRLLELLR